jgi:hypothetical protein
MKSSNSIVTVKVPLVEAQKTLTNFLEYFDTMDGEIPDDLIPELNLAEKNLAQAADRRLFLIDCLDNQIEYFDKLIKHIKDKKSKIENAKDKIMNNTFEIMKGLEVKEIRGSAKSFKIKNKGGVEAIQWTIEFNKIDNVLNEADEFFVPIEFIEEKTIRVVNKKALAERIRKENDLNCGKKVDREEVLSII